MRWKQLRWYYNENGTRIDELSTDVSIICDRCYAYLGEIPPKIIATCITPKGCQK
jgi:hypothetical protein